jgi:hypothetical protein
MEDKGRCIINLNQNTLGELSRAEGKYHMQAWFYVTAALNPDCKGVQVVTVPLTDKHVMAGAQELVKLGVLKPYRNTANKFILSRKHAFASWESDLDPEDRRRWAEEQAKAPKPKGMK